MIAVALVTAVSAALFGSAAIGVMTPTSGQVYQEQAGFPEVPEATNVVPLKKLTTFGLVLGVNSTPILRSELNTVVRTAAPNYNVASDTLNGQWDTDAASAAEIDTSGADGVGGVLYFTYGDEQDAKVGIAFEEESLSLTRNAAQVGTVPRYATSMVWTMPGSTNTGEEVSVTVAAIEIPGDVVNLTTGAPGGTIVEGVLIWPGVVPPTIADAEAELAWGLKHLDRVIHTSR